jgi:hypothetical protein
MSDLVIVHSLLGARLLTILAPQLKYVTEMLYDGVDIGSRKRRRLSKHDFDIRKYRNQSRDRLNQGLFPPPSRPPSLTFSVDIRDV